MEQCDNKSWSVKLIKCEKDKISSVIRSQTSLHVFSNFVVTVCGLSTFKLVFMTE